MKDYFRGVKSGINYLKCKLLGGFFFGQQIPRFCYHTKNCQIAPFFYKTECQCYYQGLVMMTGYSEEEHFLLHLFQCSVFWWRTRSVGFLAQVWIPWRKAASMLTCLSDSFESNLFSQFSFVKGLIGRKAAAKVSGLVEKVKTKLIWVEKVKTKFYLSWEG